MQKPDPFISFSADSIRVPIDPDKIYILDQLTRNSAKSGDPPSLPSEPHPERFITPNQLQPVAFGYADYTYDHDRHFIVPAEARLKHMAVFDRTGTGKSTSLWFS